MKTYLIFCGRSYYASGGGDDYHSTETDIEIAKEKSQKLVKNGRITDKRFYYEGCSGEEIDWAHVIDSANGKFVYRFGRVAYGREKERKYFEKDEKDI